MAFAFPYLVALMPNQLYVYLPINYHYSRNLEEYEVPPYSTIQYYSALCLDMEVSIHYALLHDLYNQFPVNYFHIRVHHQAYLKYHPEVFFHYLILGKLIHLSLVGPIIHHIVAPAIHALFRYY
jgi:hypothetical protein